MPHKTYDFDLNGHRGARGLAPENTLAAFIKALKLGVDSLEMDVVISKDGQVVVSHEPWFNPKICVKPSGEKFLEGNAHLNLFQMDYAEIKTYDCGSLNHPKYPKQLKQPAYKPLLGEVLAIAEKFSEENNQRVAYTIELKSDPATDDRFHPKPKPFAEAVLHELSRIDNHRITLQSFDYRILQYLHKHHPGFRLAALAETGSFKQNMEKLGFLPHIYSPLYKVLTPEAILEIQQKKIKVIPWTVNQPKKMEQLLSWGVDGLITDYPDKALAFKKPIAKT